MESFTNITLSNSQRKELIRYLTEKISEYQDEIKNLEDLLSQLHNKAVAAPTKSLEQKDDLVITTKKEQSESPPPDYRASWSWALKAKYVLKKIGRCLTTRQIIEEIEKIETLSFDPINSVSGTLSSKISKGILFARYQPYEGSEKYIGLKEWFRPDGTVMEEYEAI